MPRKQVTCSAKPIRLMDGLNTRSTQPTRLLCARGVPRAFRWFRHNAMETGSGASGLTDSMARARKSAITVAGLPSLEKLNRMNARSGIRILYVTRRSVRRRPGVSARENAAPSHFGSRVSDPARTGVR